MTRFGHYNAKNHPLLFAHYDGVLNVLALCSHQDTPGGGGGSEVVFLYLG